MELFPQWLGIVLIIFVVVLLLILLYVVSEFRKAKDKIERKDGFIKNIKQKNYEAKKEISRKEKVIQRSKIDKAGLGKWTPQFFAEENLDKGFFSDTYEIKYCFQLLLNGIPVGQRSIISTSKYSEVDKEMVNKILDEYAKPLLDAGLDVSVKKILE